MFCAARRKTRAKRAEIRSAQQKRPCQPKTAKRFFGGPASQGPSGQAKEQTRILPVRRGFSAPGVPRHMAGWPFLRGWPLLCWLLRPVPRRFFCKRCIRAGILWHRLSCLPAMRFACAVPSCFGCLFACSVLVARAVFSYLLSFTFSCLTSSSQISFHLSLRPRRGFSRLFSPAALFPACVVCHLLLFRGLLRPLPVFPFCIVYASFPSCFLPFPA